MRDHAGRHCDDKRKHAVETVNPAAGPVLVGRRQEDLHRAEDEEEEREADPVPRPRPGAERGQEDEQFRRVDEQEADEAVRSSALSPAPVTYAVMKYAWRKIRRTISDASTKLIHRNVRLMRASLRDPADSVHT